jgi:hypothetical protein
LPNATTKRRKITTARNETKADVPEVQVVGATTIQYEDQMLAKVKDEIPPAEVSRNKVKSNTVPKKRGRPARKDKALEIEHLVEVGRKSNVKEEEAANQHQGAAESHQATDLTDVPGTLPSDTSKKLKAPRQIIKPRKNETAKAFGISATLEVDATMNEAKVARTRQPVTRRRGAQKITYVESDDEDARPMKSTERAIESQQLDQSLQTVQAVADIASEPAKLPLKTRKAKPAAPAAPLTGFDKAKELPITISSQLAEATKPRSRGRPPKAAVTVAGPAINVDVEVPFRECAVEPATEVDPSHDIHRPRRRGKPAKAEIAIESADVADAGLSSTGGMGVNTPQLEHIAGVAGSEPKRRGRPAKKTTVEDEAFAKPKHNAEEAREPLQAQAPVVPVGVKGRRARAARATAIAEENVEPVADVEEVSRGQSGKIPHVVVNQASEVVKGAIAAPKRRGRPPKVKAAVLEQAQASDDRPQLIINIDHVEQLEGVGVIDDEAGLPTTKKTSKVRSKAEVKAQKQPKQKPLTGKKMEEGVETQGVEKSITTIKAGQVTNTTSRSKRRVAVGESMDQILAPPDQRRRLEVTGQPGKSITASTGALATDSQSQILVPRQANIMLSPRKPVELKRKLPVFKMATRRRDAGHAEWQKEDWFEPSVPASLIS